MKSILAVAALALAVGAGAGPMARAQTGHQQHQSGAGAGQPATPQQGGAPMMRNMPEACRAAMQAMPQSCMGAMHQMMQGGMAGHGQAQAAAQAAFTKAYVEAMDRMHGPMMEGVPVHSADVAFVRGMIPHHQGAIDMAKIVLQYGGDEQVKKWAVDVIREQQREIGEMEAWLAKNAK